MLLAYVVTGENDENVDMHARKEVARAHREDCERATAFTTKRDTATAIRNYNQFGQASPVVRHTCNSTQTHTHTYTDTQKHNNIWQHGQKTKPNRVLPHAISCDADAAAATAPYYIHRQRAGNTYTNIFKNIMRAHVPQKHAHFAASTQHTTAAQDCHTNT